MKRSLPSSSVQQNTNKKRHLELWHRKPALSLNPEKEALLFQQTSIEWSMDEAQKPIIHIYGTTERGNSVLCHVRGFLPYAFFAVSAEFDENDLPQFEKHLFDHPGEDCSVVAGCEIVRRRDLFGYNEEETFIKMTLTNPYKLSKFSLAVKARSDRRGILSCSVEKTAGRYFWPDLGW